MTEIYRFRNTNQLLDSKYRELEQQVVYFASPEQLNDPMEGFRDVVWCGDNIVWANLFKHYVYCLHWAYMHIKIFGNEFAFEAEHIPIWGQWDKPMTPQFGDLFEEIWIKIYQELKVSNLIDRIATTRQKVRYNELLFYLDCIHLQALSRIQEVYIRRGLVSRAQPPQDKSVFGEFILSDSNFFGLLPQAEATHENFSEIMFSISYRMRLGQRLRHKYNLRNIPLENSEKNRQLLLLDFNGTYVKELEKLLWPRWYAACFTKTDSNSSLWANYGDSHKGVCLIFDAVDTSETSTLALRRVTGWDSDSNGHWKEKWNVVSMPFHDVSYSDKPGEIDFFRNIGMLPTPALMKLWYTDEAGNTSECASHIEPGEGLEPWRKKHWGEYVRDIIFKSEDWKHEQECRLILHGLLEDSLGERHRALTYEFHSLKGIIFGIRTSDEDKVNVIEIIQRKCQENNLTDFKFFQAYYSPERGDIHKYEIPLKLADFSVPDSSV